MSKLNLMECQHCNMPFKFSKGIYPVENPGPEELGSILCPYCKKEVTQRSTNTWWNSYNLSDRDIEEYLKNKKSG